MPNWCNNTSVILSYKKDNENLKKVYNTISGIIGNGTIELYTHLTDLSEEEILSGNYDYIRGRLNDVQFDEDNQVITLYWETAWEPMIAGLECLLKPYGLHSYTIAEEPGEHVYINTDESGLYFKDKYIFDAYDEKRDQYTTEYFETEAKAVEFVRNYLGRARGMNNFEEAEVAIEKYNNKQKGDSYIVFEEFCFE